MLTQLQLPGRTDRGVETNAEIDALLATGAPVAIGVSGGKDSCAAAIAVLEHLNAIGHAGPRVLVHADLGDPDPAMDVEWSDSLPTCRRLAERLGVELVIVRREAGGMMARWRKRWENNVRRYQQLLCVRVILPWSTPSMRFCTSELKSAPIAAALVKRFPGRRIVSACGVRREEGNGKQSSPRTNAPTCEENTRLTNKRARTSGVDWNPIAAWTERDVFAFCASRSFDMHAGYALGMSRISCRFCIMSNVDDLRTSASVAENVPVFRTIAKLEAESTFGFQGSRWLADIAPHQLDDETRLAVACAKQRAELRAEIESVIPKHLLYTKGWPTVMPTFDEAVMLAGVRRRIGEVMGFAVEYTTPEQILARYAELMAENARRKAAKDSKRERAHTRAA